jgi:hypothetical protein
MFIEQNGKFILTDSKGNKTSPITGQPISESDIGTTHQMRIGGEYLFITPKYVIPHFILYLHKSPPRHDT